MSLFAPGCPNNHHHAAIEITDGLETNLPVVDPIVGDRYVAPSENIRCVVEIQLAPFSVASRLTGSNVISMNLCTPNK